MLDREALEAYQERWKAVSLVEDAEKRQASSTQRWLTMNALLRIATALGLQHEETMRRSRKCVGGGIGCEKSTRLKISRHEQRYGHARPTVGSDSSRQLANLGEHPKPFNNMPRHDSLESKLNIRENDDHNHSR